MSILSVDNIQPIGSGTSVTVNSTATLVVGNTSSSGVVTATTFVGNLTGNPTGSGANLTSLPAANLTGALPAISGANLTGITIPGGATALSLNDSVNINVGGSNDLQLSHDSNDSYITSGTGNFVIQHTNNSGDLIMKANDFYLRSNTNENYFRGQVDGAVELYFDNNKKIETTNTGAVVTGICTATSFEATTFSKTPTNTPAFHAFRNGNFSPSISDQTTTKMTLFTTETLDTDSAYDNSSSGTTANRFTVPTGKGGYYQVAAGLNFYADSNDMKHAKVMIYKNGSIAISAYGFVSSYAAGTRHLQCDVAGMLNLNASDYLEVYAYLDVNGGSGAYISNDSQGLRGNYFSAFKLII